MSGMKVSERDCVSLQALGKALPASFQPFLPTGNPCHYLACRCIALLSALVIPWYSSSLSLSKLFLFERYQLLDYSSL